MLCARPAAILLGALALLHAPAPSAWNLGGGGGIIFAHAKWTDEVRYVLANYAYYKVRSYFTPQKKRRDMRGDNSQSMLGSRR